MQSLEHSAPPRSSLDMSTTPGLPARARTRWAAKHDYEDEEYDVGHDDEYEVQGDEYEAPEEDEAAAAGEEAEEQEEAADEAAAAAEEEEPEGEPAAEEDDEHSYGHRRPASPARSDSSRKSSSRTEALFEHAHWKARKLEQQRAKEQGKFSFAPVTNSTSYRGGGGPSVTHGRLSVHERLYSHGQRKRDAVRAPSPTPSPPSSASYAPVDQRPRKSHDL
jgi:hypothetical protein